MDDAKLQDLRGAMQDDPGDLASVSAFGFSVEQAEIGDEMSFVIRGGSIRTGHIICQLTFLLREPQPIKAENPQQS